MAFAPDFLFRFCFCAEEQARSSYIYIKKNFFLRNYTSLFGSRAHIVYSAHGCQSFFLIENCLQQHVISNRKKKRKRECNIMKVAKLFSINSHTRRGMRMYVCIWRSEYNLVCTRVRSIFNIIHIRCQGQFKSQKLNCITMGTRSNLLVRDDDVEHKKNNVSVMRENTTAVKNACCSSVQTNLICK